MMSRLRKPRLLDVIKSRETDTMILEDVRNARSRALRLSDLRDFAEELGKWHAAGTHPFKTHAGRRSGGGWLREYVGNAERHVSALPAYARQSDLLKPLLEEPMAGRVAEVWRNRSLLLGALDSLPHAYSHQDLVAGNVVVDPRPGDSTYHLLDWATAGMAPLGAELAPLLAGNAILFNWSMQESQEVLCDVIDAYRQGLLSHNVHVGRDTLYFSLTASAAIRYIAWCGHRVGSVLNPAQHDLSRRVTGRPMAEMIANYCRIRSQLAEWGMSAIQALSPIDLAVNG
jgi:Ser/Thr protein kinase RdoA (MazF antagonist)